jgi:ankyrin repeat protein
MCACSAGHDDIVRELKDGARVEDNNENGHISLMEAASSGDVNVARVSDIIDGLESFRAY